MAEIIPFPPPWGEPRLIVLAAARGVIVRLAPLPISATPPGLAPCPFAARLERVADILIARNGGAA